MKLNSRGLSARDEWRNVVKKIRENIASLLAARRPHAARWLKPALALAIGLLAISAVAQPANDYFTNAFVLAGTTGSTNGDNTLATLEPCEAATVNTSLYPNDPVTNSVWYLWTAPTNGTGFLELDTAGSTNEMVLSVWATTNGLATTNTLCNANLTNLISDDDGQVSYSEVKLSVAAGNTYYISVSSWDNPLGPGVGGYQLNWNATIPTVPSGQFKFTATNYNVSELEGFARITVTRPQPAYGRVLIDYQTIPQLVTNTYTTNYYGTNISFTLIDTNGVGWTTNISENYVVFSDVTQVYLNGRFQNITVTGAQTNTTVQVDNAITNGSFTVPSTSFVIQPLTPLPVAPPALVNNTLGPVTTLSAVGTNVVTTTVFGLASTNLVKGTNYLSGATFSNGLNTYTNYASYWTNSTVTYTYGTNIFLASYLSGVAQLFTNYFYTNVVVFNFTYTNVVYTNGLLLNTNFIFASGLAVSGTNYSAGSSSNNVGSILAVTSSGTGVLLPTPTVLPPLGTRNLGVGYFVDPNGNTNITSTNSYRLATIVVTNIVAAPGYIYSSNTIAFNNYQMSQDITVPFTQVSFLNGGIPGGSFSIQLSNPRLDPQEPTAVLMAPTLSPTGSNASLSILSTTYPIGGAVFNFERATYQVDKDVNPHTVTLYVECNGAHGNSVSVDYSIDPTCPLDGGVLTPFNFIGGYCPTGNQFPLQAGSDYATPNSDYTPITGTLTWPANNNNVQTITVTITNNALIENNVDFHVQLSNPREGGQRNTAAVLGMVNASSVTILFDDVVAGQQPAGAVDRTWNMNGVFFSSPPYISHPGTDGGGGTVYAVAEQPDGSVIVAGSFISYDSNPYNRIVRVLNDGFQDPNFLVAPNSGANDYIDALALQPNGQIIIGGNFTAFNGYNRHYVARLNSDGSVDTSFNPGLGANGTVTSVALEASGQIIIGGSFTAYNGTAVNGVARLNADGSLDTTFNPGVGPNGTVNAVAVDTFGRVVIGGSFDSVDGVTSGAVARLNIDGSLDTTFAPGIATLNPETFITDPVNAVAIQPNGQILIGGSFAYLDLLEYNGLARLNIDGTVDLTFQPGTGTLNPITGNADTVNAILLQPDGNILIGGNFTTFNQTRRVGLARLFATDGTVDTSFMDPAYNQYAGVPNQYFNESAVGTNYPYLNTRNVIYALAFEASSNVIIGGNFLEVGGGYTRDDIRPRNNVARLIGGATPGPGNLSFANSSYTVNNSAGQLYVSLTRNNGNLGIISATFSTNTAAPGPGIAGGADFSLNPIYANPTWTTAWYLPAWMYGVGVYGPNYATTPLFTGNADVYVGVTNSGNISGNLSANFALSNPVGNFALGGEYIPLGAALGAQATAPLTIIDVNTRPGVLGFSSPAYSVIENGSVATITVTRTNGSDGIVNVYYATSNGTATNGVDYQGTTNAFATALQPGQTSATFTIPTLGHYTSIQPDKTVILRLFTPSGGATLGLTNAVLTLINPNYTPGHVSFSATNYAVAENAGSVLVTVNRLGGSTTSLGVTAIVAGSPVVNGAVNGTNYIGSTNVFTWAAGDATSRTFSIPVKDDGVVTPNLVAYLQLTNSLVNGTNNPAPLLFGGTNATLTINNVDSSGVIQFTSPIYSVKKYGGYALIPVTRLGGSIGTVSVNYTTLDNTAVQPANYTYATNTLTFTNGQVSQYFTVPVIDDGQPNSPSGPKSLFLQLSTNGLATAATLGAPTNATLYIIDSDSVNEPPGSPDSTYSTFAGFNNNVYALVLQANNQLLVGGDFTMADGVTRNHLARLNENGTLDAGFLKPSYSWGANGSVWAIAVQPDTRILVGGSFSNFNSVARGKISRINQDGTLDSLFNPGSGADNSIYAVASTTVNGQTNMVLLGGAFASFNGTPVKGVARLNNSGTLDATFNIGGQGANATVYALAVQPADGKVVIGGDFTAFNGNTNYNHIARLNTDGTLDTNFNVGFGVGDSVRAIALQLDGKILIGGLFTNVNGTLLNHLARLNANGTVDSSFNPGVGASDAVFGLALQSDNRIVVVGEFTTCSGVTRNRITRLNPDGSVDPTINFGTGANDFVQAVVVQEDSIAGYPAVVPDEKIIIGGGFTNYDGQLHSHLARIFGGSIGGSGAFQFSSAYYGVDEKGTNVTITVVRTGGTTNSATFGDIIATAATVAGGTAVAGTNYVAVSTNLDFPLGEVIRSFTIPVMDDGVVTPNLTVDLAITNLTAPAQIGNQPTAVLTITNDDTTVSFAAANYSVAKNVVSGVAAISIVRVGGVSGSASVSFATTSTGTAQIGTDYTPTNETVVFSPGVSNVTVFVPVNNNGIPEGNQTVGLQLANATGTVLASPTNATLTIIDTANAPGQLSFATNSYTITEGDGVGYTNAYITVVRTFGSVGTISVGFSTLDGTAQSGIKYVATNGVLTFAAGETSKTFLVPVINTPTAEGPESLSLYLYNPTGGASLASPTNTTLTILNTNIGIAFVSAVNAFTEPSGTTPGTLLLNVVRFNNTAGTTTVLYTTTNGTAVSGVNFIGVTNGVLTFYPGDSVKSIALTTLHDPLVTGDLSFSVGLSSPSTPAQLTSPTFTVVTDHDADNGLSFFTNATSVYRNAGYVFIPVQCSNTSAEPVSVNFATGGGSAVPGTDYTATNGTLVFTNGISFSYFFVPILVNNQVQTNRTFNVTLSNPSVPGVLVPPSVETVTIIGTNVPAGLSFLNPITISGNWGTTNVDNTAGAPETGDPIIAGQPASAPVWFLWTAPADGEVSVDTIGSYGTNGLKLDTVLGVFTGNNLSALSQVAANDDLYPQQLGSLGETQFNQTAQNIFNTNQIVTAITNTFFINNTLTNVVFYFTNNYGQFSYVDSLYYQPYGGPSGLRFNAKAGTTYYIAADTKSSYSYVATNGYPGYILIITGRGPISLNWAYHPSGVVRFATEDIDLTSGQYSQFGGGFFGLNSSATANPMLLYECSETESSRRTTGNVDANQFETTFHSYYGYDVPGLLVTVTRVAGASGRIAVDYATVDGSTNLITNGDNPAVGGLDYSPVSGTLIFDDFEMSKTIMIPIYDDYGQARPNRDFMINLSNPRVDSADASLVSAPRLDTIYARAMCRILDCDIDPNGPSSSQVVTTNLVFGTTNTVVTTNVVFTLIPTNSIFNLQKKSFRVGRDAQSAYWGNTPVTVYVNRMGTNQSAAKLAYRIDNYFMDKNGPDDGNNEFPLLAGSEYATPPQGGGVRNPSAVDYNGIDGETGTLTFPAGADKGAFNPQPIHFTINNNKLTGFNKDIHISVYNTDSKGNYLDSGMVTECTLTILFDDLVPPAGSVDEFFNPDFGSDLVLPTASIGSSVPHPGTEAYSEVYGVAVNPTTDQAIIGGAFSTYTDANNTHTVNGLARLNLDGSLDTTFNSGSGIDVFPGGEFIRSVAMSGSQVVIGGDFTSYNGIQRNGVARVNSDGSLDTTFNPGAGANGAVWSVVVQPDGRVLIGGEFTAYNGAAANHVARLNLDGSLDTTFNASNLITGPVYALAMPPVSLLNFNHNSTGSSNEDDQVLNLGPLTAGTLTVNYNMFTAPDDLKIYYGDTNVVGGTGVLLYDTGLVSYTNTIILPFGPTNGITTNVLTLVMNQGGQPYVTFWTYNASVAAPGLTGLAVGGNFQVAGQTYANLAMLNTDGSLNSSFSPSTGPDNSVLSLAWQLDNRIIAGGSFKHVNGVAYNRLARLNTDGSIDANFYIGTGADNVVNSITEQPLTGLIYVGGPFTSVNGTHRLGFARLNADGTVDTSFLDPAYNQLAGLPRIRFSDSPGTVYSSAIQGNGNVIIGGSFSQVGGGQFDERVRPNDYSYYDQTAGTYTYDPDFNVYPNLNFWPEPKTRDGVRNRGNVARLIGGATPGPGNIGLAATAYAANKTQSYEAVSLVRTNGNLGYASANFSVLSGLAQNNLDYSYNGIAPTYPIEWEYLGPSRQHSDGLLGPNGLMYDPNYNWFYKFGFNGPASVNVSIINNTTTSGNLSAQFQLANPGADMFYLGGQLIPLGVALGESSAPLTVVDNSHNDGVFGFGSSSYVATNSSASISLVRSNGLSGTVQVYYQTTTAGSTAVAGTDYTPTSGEVTFNPSQSSNSFPVIVLENSYISSQEKTVNLQLNNVVDLSSGNASLGQSNAVLRIINPNFPGYLSFSANAYYGNLSAGLINVTVSRVVGSKGTVSVQYATTNGTALNGVDYVGSTNTLTWNNGDVSARTITVPLINSHLIGTNKLFFANLFNPTDNGFSAPALLAGMITNAVLNINNDNSYGTFQFSSPGYQFNENGGYATLTVTRTGSALSTASVGYFTVDATALAVTNFVNPTNGNYYATNSTLTFAPGQLSQSFKVWLRDDGVTNPPPASFFFSVCLTNPVAGSTLGSPTNTQVHLVDAESYIQPAGSVDTSFNPSAGMNASVLALALQANGQLVAGGSFTVANGTSLNRLARLNADGSLDTAFLSGLAGADGSVNAVVCQSDQRLLVGGAFANIDGIVRHRVARLMTDGSLDTSFNPGAGADSTVFSVAETFINGARGIYAGGAFSAYNGISSPGVVRLNNDGSVDHTFATGLGVNGTVYAVAAYPTNSIYNAGKVLVGGQFTNFNGTVVGNLVRLNANGSLDTNFNLNVSANNAIRAIALQSDDSVLIGGDFTNVNGVVVNHLARLNASGTNVTLDLTFNGNLTVAGVNGTVNAIALQADNRIVVGGQFSSANGVTRHNITRLLPTGAVDSTINFGDGANGAVNAAVIQPADGKIILGGNFTQYNDQPHPYIVRIYGGSTTGSGGFQFTSANYQIDEDAGFATITVERTGGTSGTNADGSGDVYVTFATTSGSAVNGINYTGKTNILDFPVGEVYKTIYVPVMDDQVITPNLTVNLSLSNPTPGAGLGDQSTALLTIVNDDSVVEFLSATYSVPKNTINGVATIDIARLGSTSGSCTVNFATGTNGTAVIGTDYYPTNALITFNPGDSDEQIQVPIINNLLPEGNRTVNLTLTNALNAALNVQLASPSNAVLTIVDTVQAPGQLFFAATNFAANSSDGAAYLTVLRTNGTSGSVSVTYYTVSGTALPGYNYLSTTNTLTFNDGDTNKVLSIPLINNPTAQSAVSLTVNLANPTGGAGLIAPTNTTLTIYNTNAAFSFTLATNSTPENAGPATVVVQRLNNTNLVSSVHIATADGTGTNAAHAGINYVATSSNLVFGVGEVLQSVSIPLINQSNVTDLAFSVGLSNPGGAQLLAPSNTVVIVQASAAGLSFTNSTMTVPKNAGVAVITVVCSNPRVEPLSGVGTPLQVGYLTFDGSAKAGINYQAVSGALVFTNGIGTNTFTVPIYGNQSVTGDETFTVVLTNATAPGRITPYATQTVDIAESNAGLRFSQPNYNVYKNGVVATINVLRTGFTNSAVSVNYLATNGTAINGQNFYATNGTLLFPAGVTSQSFNVPLIANAAVQPNLFALMFLSSPTNAQVVNPGAATLTILENGGSYVIPAGSQLLTNSSLADMNNTVIGSNDTVQVMFAFRDSAGLNVTNLVAYLLATNGVVSPSPASQAYGPLTVYGHSVSRPFAFTAQGTNGLNITPTFQLYDNGKFIGPATFTYTLGTWTTQFANTNTIIINDNTSASPYPSTINVTGVGSTLIKATVTLTNLSHMSASDIDALVVSPTTNTLIMMHVGGSGVHITHATLTFDDAATTSLPQNGAIVTSTNKPSAYGTVFKPF